METTIMFLGLCAVAIFAIWCIARSDEPNTLSEQAKDAHDNAD